MRLLNLVELDKFPSLNDGMVMSRLEEILDDCFGIIMKITIHKNFPSEVFGTSMTILHFYTLNKSLKTADFDKLLLCVTSVFLACKLNHSFFPITEANSVYISLKNQMNGYLFSRHNSANNEYVQYITRCEYEILNIFGYHIDIETPYNYLNELVHTKLDRLKKRTKITNLAFNLLNDTFRRNFCLFYENKVIAMSCLLISLCVFDKLEKFKKFEEDLFKKKLNTHKNLRECIHKILNLFNKIN